VAILNRLRTKFDLRYAVTEIILISIAILLALAIDQWWQNKADRRAELEYLIRLEVEFGQNRQMIEFWISKMEEKRRFVLTLKEGEIDTLLDQDASSLWQAFNVSSLPCFPPLRAASYTELLSTGQLGLLRDDAIRRALVNYYATFEAASEGASRNAPLAYNAIIFKRFSPDAAYSAAVLGDAERADIAAGLTAMRNDPDLSQAATAEANYAISCIESLEQMRARAEELHSLLRRAE